MREFSKALRGGGFLLFLAGTLAISFLSFQRKIDSFSRIDFNARASRGEIEIVTPPDRAPSTLRVGDRIVLIDGAPVAGYADPSGALSRPPFPHRLAVVRDGEVVAATLGAAAPAIDLPYLFLAFVGILYLLIGLVTLGRERNPATALFALFCVSAFAIDVLTPSGPIDGMWKAIWLTEDFFRAIGPALLLHFFLVFPKPAGGRRRLAIYLVPAVYLGAQIAISLPALGVAPDRLAFWVEFLERFWLLYFAGYAAAAIVRIVGAARNRTDAASQRQARWIALGTTFGLSPFLLLYAIPRAFGYSSEWAACAGIVPLVFVPLGFAYALWRWRLWDVDIFAREAAATAAAVFLGAAAFVLVNALLNRVLAGFASGAKNLLAFGSGIFLASLLVPVKRRFSDAIERFQYGETYRARRALLDFSREWRGIRDVALLAEALASALSDALKVSPCRIFLFDRPLPAGLSREALLEKFAASDSVRVRSATFPSGEDLTLFRLHEDGYRHLSALKSGGRIVGALAFGLKEGKVPLSSEDQALLSTVLAQASLAFENAELYRALERRMEEIRSLQEFQEGVIRSSSAGIVVQDARGSLVSANPAFESLIGAGEAELVGRPLAEVVPEIDAAALEGERSSEVRARNRRGEERIYRISASPLKGSDSARVVIFDDITERIALEKSASEKERLASLGVLAAGVAHEVNTPLAGISSYAQMLLADTAHSDPRYAILKKMERQTFRASRLVGNLLEFARGRHGEHDPIDLARVIGDAVESSEPALAARSVRVEPSGLGAPLPAKGNARELEQVFVNLLINARDASPDGAAIGISATAEADGYRVEILDRGKGLTEEEARRAFEPFFTTRRSGGTGLGLSIAREIVERHGGTIRLDPRDGGGTAATVWLPRAAGRVE